MRDTLKVLVVFLWFVLLCWQIYIRTTDVWLWCAVAYASVFAGIVLYGIVDVVLTSALAPSRMEDVVEPGWRWPWVLTACVSIGVPAWHAMSASDFSTVWRGITLLYVPGTISGLVSIERLLRWQHVKRLPPELRTRRQLWFD